MPIEYGKKRSICVDLAVISNDLEDKDVLQRKGQAEFVAEFKFEPSEMRKKEICIHKLPVVGWSEVLEDAERVKRFVDNSVV